jgi:hypothetical protein
LNLVAHRLFLAVANPTNTNPDVTQRFPTMR